MFLLFLIHLLAAFLGVYLQVVLLCKTVSVHRPRLYILLNSLICMSLWCVNNYILSTPSAVLSLILATESPVITVLFAQKGQRLKAMLAITVYVGVQMVTVYLVGLVAFPVGELLGYSEAALRGREISPIMSTLCLLVYWPVALLSYRLMRKLLTDRPLSLWPLLFLPIPISQIIILSILFSLMPETDLLSGINPELTLAILLSLMADAAFFVGIVRIRKTSQLEEQIRIAQEQLNIQIGYYSQLRQSILTINQIRHDLNNQLQAAYYLLEQGESTQARSQLDQLQSSLQDRVGPRYCANLMVDAVLTDKVRICREQGIHLDINTNLPAEIPVESAHLCSAFSNLLDNGIQGTIASAAEKKYIELQAALHSDCLIIRCSNPAAPNAAKRRSNDLLRTHGLGLDILRRIAAEYDGTLDTAYENGLFEAVLILKYKNT